MRTPAEIVARIEAIGPLDDLFGAQRYDLVCSMPYEHAKPYLRDEVTAETYVQDPDPRASALAYIPFAIGKATDHRGLSASRSIDHLKAWAWLLGDDVLAAVEAADFENYGAPKIRAFLEAIDALDHWPADDEALNRMARGEKCAEDCWEGCGS